MSPSFQKAKRHLDLALPLALDLDQQHMLTSLAAGKNSEPQAYWVSNSIRHGGGMKTTIPKNPAFDYTYANENILAKS